MISVSDHAKLRYQQRVEPMEPFPDDRIRERFEQAELIRDASIPGTAYRSGEAIFVVNEGSITTVLNAEGVEP